METVVEFLSACVEAHSPMGPLGSRALASPTPGERVSGAEEGAVVLLGCSLNLHGLLAHGDRVEACQGSPHDGVRDGMGGKEKGDGQVCPY